LRAKLKKLFLISAALLAAISSARSADLPRAYTNAPVAPMSSWTGFYAGVNVGYGFNDPTASFAPNDRVTAAQTPLLGSQSTSYDIKGAIGGVQVGYNWQISQNWLFGLEADFQGSDVKGGGSAAFSLNGIDAFNFGPQQNVDWFGTVRARVGWLATNQLLMFATGGLAYGAVHNNTAFSTDSFLGSGDVVGGFGFTCGAGPCFVGNQTKIQTGYAVGGGFEYAAWQNVSFKVEYLYVNLGSSDGIATALAVFTPGNAPSSFKIHFSDLDFNVVRAGINYRF
jgi:outer membrane immunogenic protein